MELFCQRHEAYEILERIASNNCQWADLRSNPGRKTRGVLEVDALSSINAQLASVINILQTLALGQDSMIKAPVHTAAVINQTATESCVYCGEEHTFDQCPSNLASIFYVGNQVSQGNPKNNPFSNLIIRGGEIIQISHGRDKAHTTNKCPLKQITLRVLDYKIN